MCVVALGELGADQASMEDCFLSRSSAAADCTSGVSGVAVARLGCATAALSGSDREGSGAYAADGGTEGAAWMVRPCCDMAAASDASHSCGGAYAGALCLFGME